MRVPVVAFKLMTNWLGSVRGKYASPMSGYSARLKRKMPVMPSTVANGRSKARFSQAFVAIQPLMKLCD